jgi:hypothetical protein
MKNIPTFLVFLTLTLASQIKAQNYWDLAFQSSQSAYTNWNHSIRYFNESRFWQEKSLAPLEWSRGGSVCYSGVLGKGLFISPQLSYAHLKSEGTAAQITLRNYSAQVGIDVYPLEFKLDSVAFIVRPFFRFAGGGDLYRPTITLINAPATYMDQPYKPYCWTYRFESSLGLRARITDVLGIHVLGGYRFSKVSLENFHAALNGTTSSTLSDTDKINTFVIQTGITWRLH